MPIDENLLLYSLANMFHTTIGIAISNGTTKFMKAMTKKFNKLPTSEKMYYAKYAIQLATSLANYLKDISFFEINDDGDSEIIHDFRLTLSKNNVVHVSMIHSSIGVRDIIPKKLMKICRCKKNTNRYKAYMSTYDHLNNQGYQKVKKYERYSEIEEKLKNKAIIFPFRDLLKDTISKKRKFAVPLYHHLFQEQDRIVFRLYKNRFIMYDFGRKLEDVSSFKLKLDQNGNIVITFSNNTKFVLTLQTNASKIKPNLSIKFHTDFKNMDDFFAITSENV